MSKKKKNYKKRYRKLKEEVKREKAYQKLSAHERLIVDVFNGKIDITTLNHKQ